jgi:hypothetical protein
MQIQDHPPNDPQALICETVKEVLDDYLEDPDAGLLLSSEVNALLAAAQTRRVSGQRGIPAAEVAKQFGLDWQ